MRSERLALSCLVATHFLSCAPAPRQGGDLTPAPRKHPRVEDEIRRSRADFYQAAAAGDARAMARLFAVDGILITWSGDSIRGRDAIAHYFGTARPAAGAATFRFDREPPLKPCTDGAFERGVYWAEVRDSAGALDTLVGRFTTRWTRDSLGNTQVQWAVLSSRSQEPVIRPPLQSACVNPEFFQARAFQKASRFAITLFPVGFFTRATADVESAMSNRGWRDRVPTTTPPSPGPVSNLTGLATLPPSLGSARYRFSDGLVGELIIGALPRGSTLGRNDSRSSELEIWWSGMTVGTVLYYERWGFRAGVGPAIERAQWRVEDRPYSSAGCPSCPVFRTSARSSVVGLLVDLGFRYPVAGRLELNLHSQTRRFAKSLTPGTPNFAPARVAYNGSVLGLGFGVLF
jgi:ketosteroid isomerase-like protein